MAAPSADSWARRMAAHSAERKAKETDPALAITMGLPTVRRTADTLVAPSVADWAWCWAPLVVEWWDGRKAAMKETLSVTQTVVNEATTTEL